MEVRQGQGSVQEQIFTYECWRWHVWVTPVCCYCPAVCNN